VNKCFYLFNDALSTVWLSVHRVLSNDNTIMNDETRIKLPWSSLRRCYIIRLQG
jgi:hypothetical protein